MASILAGINRHWCIGVTLVVTLAAAPVARGDSFYKDSDMPGYWWGKDPVEVKKEEQQKTEKSEQQKPGKEKKEPRYPKMSDFSTQDLYDMYPDQFVELMDDFKKQAVQRPNEENVSAYLKMQDISVRKAVTFDNVARLAMQKNPELSLENDFQTSGPGKEAARVVQNKEYDDMIVSARNNFGLIYFYQDGCPYCEAEEKVLQFLKNRGWLIKPVNIKHDQTAAAKFNITVTPSLLLVKKGDERHIPISHGVITYVELRERIYNGVRFLNGEVTPEQFGMRESERGGGFDTTAPLRR